MLLYSPKARRVNSPVCLGCGIKDARRSCTLSFEFRPQASKLERHAYQTAKRVVDEGDAKISELEKAIKRLGARKKQIKRVVDQHRQHLGVVHRLPDEVLLLVFEEVSGRHRDTKAQDGDKIVTPWLISRVCK